ncbi:MAG: MBL fold metallo-hydrolase, partial [Leptospiraceae bacterium]|nr:MBL fold metallo-hydrolase [Leptospiraceae bacterium]
FRYRFIFLLCTVPFFFGCITVFYPLDPQRVESPHYRDGRYQNLYDDTAIVEKGFHTFLYWKLFGEEDPPAVDPLPEDPPVVKPLTKDDFFPPEGTLRILWLGHSTTWLAATVKGRTYHLVLDPVLGDVITRPRISKLPIEKSQLPSPDMVLISHAHRDHLDVDSLQFFAKRNHAALFLLPAGMTIWAKEEGLNAVIQEWWDRTESGPFEVQYVPAQHWSKMGLNDTMQYHWGGYWIRIGNRNVFFAGDTAYSSHFQDIRDRREETLDLALMPIGAFKPRWFMKAAHIDPVEALQASRILRAAQMAPVHWGTFELGDDGPMESLLYLKELIEQQPEEDLPRVIPWTPGQFLDFPLREYVSR